MCDCSERASTLLRECPSIEVLGANTLQETPQALLTITTDVALVDALSPAIRIWSWCCEICAREYELWRSVFANCQ